MFSIDDKSRLPVYEQIKNQVMLFIQLGIYTPNEQLPSVRALSRDINVNVNTVKRAFTELENDGVIYTVPGKGSYINENAFSNNKIKENAIKDVIYAIKTAIPKGVEKDDIQNIIDDIF